MEHRLPLKSGDEFDALTRWRRYLHWEPGERRRIKRAYRKRARREQKDVVRNIISSPLYDNTHSVRHRSVVGDATVNGPRDGRKVP